jgi:hypothetical protein
MGGVGFIDLDCDVLSVSSFYVLEYLIISASASASRCLSFIHAINMIHGMQHLSHTSWPQALNIALH